jgi:hypothetical protein
MAHAVNPDGSSDQGMGVFLNGSPVDWAATKMISLTLSACEGEYVALVQCAKSLKSVRMMGEELGMVVESPSRLGQDNKGTIQLASQYTVGKRTRHIDYRLHWIRDEVHLGSMKMAWVPTNSMFIDSMTKVTPLIRFQEHRRYMMGYSDVTELLTRWDALTQQWFHLEPVEDFQDDFYLGFY